MQPLKRRISTKVQPKPVRRRRRIADEKRELIGNAEFVHVVTPHNQRAQANAIHLQDRRFSAGARTELAAEIGQKHGNRHLIRAMQATGPELAAGQTQPSALQTAVDDQIVARIGQYDEIIDRVAVEEGLHPNLVRGIIAAESGGRAHLKAPSGYAGLMQAGKGANQLDPETSIRTGILKYKQFLTSLSQFLQQHNTDPASLADETMIGLVMVAYNAGPGTVRKAMEYALEAGNLSQWMEPEHFQRALLYYGSYSVKTALRSALQALDGSALAAELSGLTGQTLDELHIQYFAPNGWNVQALRKAITDHVEGERVQLRRQDLTLEEARGQASQWLLQAIEFKYHNIRSWYVNRVLQYMQHFDRVRPVQVITFEEPDVIQAN